MHAKLRRHFYLKENVPSIKNKKLRNAPEELIVSSEMCSVPVKQESLGRNEEYQTTDVTLFTCDVCNNAFNTHSDLNVHKIECINSSNASTPQEIFKDNNVTNSINKTTRHQYDAKTDDEIFECENCNMTFADKEYLVRHKVRCKNHEFSNFRCEICHRGFTAKGSLDLHVDSVHLKKKEFGCSLCGKLFSRKHILKIHLDTHYGKRNFQCAYCGKTFLQKSNFNRHQRIHEAKNFGYKCRFCGQAFTQNKHLQKHMSTIHIQEKTEAV